jgi:hypothetical protein
MKSTDSIIRCISFRYRILVYSIIYCSYDLISLQWICKKIGDMSFNQLIDFYKKYVEDKTLKYRNGGSYFLATGRYSHIKNINNSFQSYECKFYGDNNARTNRHTRNIA